MCTRFLRTWQKMRVPKFGKNQLSIRTSTILITRVFASSTEWGFFLGIHRTGWCRDPIVVRSASANKFGPSVNFYSFIFWPCQFLELEIVEIICCIDGGQTHLTSVMSEASIRAKTADLGLSAMETQPSQRHWSTRPKHNYAWNWLQLCFSVFC